MSIPQEIQKMLDTPTLASLGPERRTGALNLDQCHAALDTLDLAPNQQTLIHSALLLWHDHLDASHDLSQNINSNDGSFLHGMIKERGDLPLCRGKIAIARGHGQPVYLADGGAGDNFYL